MPQPPPPAGAAANEVNDEKAPAVPAGFPNDNTGRAAAAAAVDPASAPALALLDPEVVAPAPPRGEAVEEPKPPKERGAVVAVVLCMHTFHGGETGGQGVIGAHVRCGVGMMCVCVRERQ